MTDLSRKVAEPFTKEEEEQIIRDFARKFFGNMRPLEPEITEALEEIDIWTLI